MATDRDDERLEALFQGARGAERPSEALVARVLADAATVQAASRGGSARSPGALRGGGGWLSGIVGALGGWPGVSGVTLAGVTGLMPAPSTAADRPRTASRCAWPMAASTVCSAMPCH